MINQTLPWSSAAENVAQNRSVAGAVDGWLNSSGHRENIEGSYSRTGVGTANAGRLGLLHADLHQAEMTVNGSEAGIHMAHDNESQELRAALRECLRGCADLLTVARCLLAQVEQRIPLPADSLALHQEKFDRVEGQVRQLQGMLDAFVVPRSGQLH